MKFPDFDKVILFGGSLTLVGLARWLQTEKMDVKIYTSPRHLIEPLDPDGTTLSQMLDNLELSYVETEDINAYSELIDEITNTTIGIGIGEAWSFNSEIIEAFGGRLLDYMGIPLPRYRGGAHYTWMILREDRHSGCRLQIINTDMVQGVFDSGEIVKSMSFNFPNDARIPEDYFNTEVEKAISFIKEFLIEVREGKEFSIKAIDESKSLFLPRLNTLKQGWINWSWSGRDIERFIRSFDNPYMGASTLVEGKQIFLKGAILDKSEAAFHPFQSGLITRLSEYEGVVVATTSGHLIIKAVYDVEGRSIMTSLRTGMRFFTPDDQLNNALIYKAKYDTKGLQSDDEKQSKDDSLVLKGKNISLRPVRIEDCTQTYVDWLNNPNVNCALETRFKEQTLDSVREFVDHIRKSKDSYLFAIILNENGRHIGNTKIGPIDFNHMFGDVSYFIGETDFWKKGLATEAVSLITRFAFKHLGMHKCMAGVYASNKGSCRVLEKVGYRQEGRITAQYKSHNGWEDHIIYGLLNEEFNVINEQ